MTTKSAAATIERLRYLFTRHGIPETLKQMESLTYFPLRTTQCPSNGQAERFVDTFKRAFRKIKGEGVPNKEIINTFLVTYRTTPNDSLPDAKSPTILSDLNQLDSIDSSWVLPDVIGDFDRPNLTAGEILSKWLHTPKKDGQPKRLRCSDDFASASRTIEWVNNFKKKFLCAATSAGYKIQFFVHATPTSMVPFELANDQTQEKLTLTKATENEEGISLWIMKRCPIGETAAVLG
ncbi:hypothetical protein niasHT_017840 [Heterodera trifolii]|uniref:Integrase catalytic domain-containing protein n=1 Tax=Heterodera trifolii TaxID=157864 RepID=A0ABD2LKQ7_9BILA